MPKGTNMPVKRRCYYSHKSQKAIDVTSGREDDVQQVILEGYGEGRLVLTSGEEVRIAQRDPVKVRRQCEELYALWARNLPLPQYQIALSELRRSQGRA